MKKLLLLFCALLCGVSGAWAQVSTVSTGVNYYWRLYDTSNQKARYISADGTKTGGSESYANAGTFQLEDAGDGYYYIHEMTTGKYVYTTETAAITNLSETSGPIYSNNSQVIFTGAKANTDYFKWQLSAGSAIECFTISSKANSNAVIAAQSQGDTKVAYYKKSGYGFSNSQFIVKSDYTEIEAATASITNGTAYRIFTKFDKSGGTEGDTKYYLTTGGVLTNNVASAGNFTFTATTGSSFNYFIPAGKAWFISPDNSKHFTNPDGSNRTNKICTTTRAAQQWDAQVFYKNEDGLYAVRATNIVGASTWNPNAFWTVEDNGNTLPDADYATTLGEKHYVWRLEPVVTYNLKFNGSTIASKVLTKELGDSEDLLPDDWDKANCSYSFEPATIVAGTNSVDVTMTWNGPFTISSDFNTATWYYLKFAGKYASYAAAETRKIPLSSSKTTNLESMWAFIGNPFDGVKVVNLSKGDGYYMEFSGYVDLKTSGFINCTIEENGGNFYLNVGDGFYATLCHEDDIEALGIQQSRTAFANMTVEAVDFKALAQSDLTTYASEHAVGEYFGVLESTISGASSNISNGTLNVDGVNYKWFLNTYIPTFIAPNIKYPATGYYRIKNLVEPTYYINATGDGKLTGSTNNTSASSVVYITNIDDGNKKFYLQWQGQYAQTPTTGNQVTLDESALQYTMTAKSDEPGWASMNQGGETDGNLNLQGGSNIVVGYYAATSNRRSFWTVEEASTVAIPMNKVGDQYWGTMYLPFDVTLPAVTPSNGVIAYRVTVTPNNRAQLTSLGYIRDIPANTPVLLYGEGCGTSFAANITSGASAIAGDNDLEGTYFDKTTLEDNEYVFGTSDGELGFWKLRDGYKLGANKAYLVVPGGSTPVKGYTISLDDLVDGVKAMENGQLTTENDNVIFNLAGQRMSRVQKGVNIVNGKKVLVK